MVIPHFLLERAWMALPCLFRPQKDKILFFFPYCSNKLLAPHIKKLETYFALFHISGLSHSVWKTMKILHTCVKVFCFEFFQAWTSIGYSIISYLKIKIQTNFRWYGHLIQTTYEPITFTSPTISPIMIDLLIKIKLGNE